MTRAEQTAYKETNTSIVMHQARYRTHTYTECYSMDKNSPKWEREARAVEKPNESERNKCGDNNKHNGTHRLLWIYKFRSLCRIFCGILKDTQREREREKSSKKEEIEWAEEEYMRNVK